MRCFARFTVLTILAANICSAGTVFIGFKDTAGANIDYDYNDLVFSVSSPTLQVFSGATWVSPQPALTESGATADNVGLLAAPYWNNTSWDGAKTNIGWCIYGGGACNNGVGLDPSAAYLTTDALSVTGSPDDVLFESSGPVTVQLLLHLAGARNYLSWYNAGMPQTPYAVGDGGEVPLTVTFTPQGLFGLSVYNEVGVETFFTNTADGGTADSVSHFAYFATPSSPSAVATLNNVDIATPEPGTWTLALGALGLLQRKLRRRG